MRPERGRLTVRGGPFANADEALAGFYLVEVGAMDEAVRLARDYPMPEGLGCIELRPVMTAWDYSPSVECPARAATIWGLYADVGSWPEWKSGIGQVRLDGPFETGARGWLTPTGGGPLPYRVAEAVVNESYTSETEIAEGVQLRVEHRLTALPDGGTRITHSVRVPRSALDAHGLEFSPRLNDGIRRTLAQLSARAVAVEAAAPV